MICNQSSASLPYPAAHTLPPTAAANARFPTWAGVGGTSGWKTALFFLLATINTNKSHLPKWSLLNRCPDEIERAPRGRARLVEPFCCFCSQLNGDVIKPIFHKRISFMMKLKHRKQADVILRKGNRITKLTRFEQQHRRERPRKQLQREMLVLFWATRRSRA